MAITNLNGFLEEYFIAQHCDLIQNQDGVLTVQLTEEMDQSLMNRPFYWHYVKSSGIKGNPMQLTLITNPEKREERGEWIHFGSPRLQQILSHLKENERFTKLFQKVQTTQNTPLYPWLIANIKITYQGKQKKEEVVSIGLHLVNGMMKLDIMNQLKELALQMTISDYCYTLSPLIKPQSGYLRIEKVLLNYIENQSYVWATESLQTKAEEIETLKHFYEGLPDDIQMKKEINEINDRYQPSVTIKVINGGIFYLTDSF